jgi:hypothetical protein
LQWDAYVCLARSITRELPDNIPFEAKVSLIESFQRSWGPATKTCFHRVRDATLKTLYEVINKQFERYVNLQNQLRYALSDFHGLEFNSFGYRNFITELVQDHHNQCLAALKTILEMEKTPFTQNTHYLETCTEKWLSKYKDAKAGKVDGENGLSDEGPQPAKKQRREKTGDALTDPPATSPTKTQKQENIFGSTENSFATFGEHQNHLHIRMKIMKYLLI